MVPAAYGGFLFAIFTCSPAPLIPNPPLPKHLTLIGEHPNLFNVGPFLCVLVKRVLFSCLKKSLYFERISNLRRVAGMAWEPLCALSRVTVLAVSTAEAGWLCSAHHLPLAAAQCLLATHHCGVRVRPRRRCSSPGVCMGCMDGQSCRPLGRSHPLLAVARHRAVGGSWSLMRIPTVFQGPCA